MPISFAPAWVVLVSYAKIPLMSISKVLAPATWNMWISSCWLLSWWILAPLMRDLYGTCSWYMFSWLEVNILWVDQTDPNQHWKKTPKLRVLKLRVCQPKVQSSLNLFCEMGLCQLTNINIMIIYQLCGLTLYFRFECIPMRRAVFVTFDQSLTWKKSIGWF